MYEISKKNMSLSYFWSFNIHILGHRGFERQLFKQEKFLQSRWNWFYKKKKSQVQEDMKPGKKIRFR